MGTRGLIIIRKNKKYRLAIYNHQDSYPSSLGYAIVSFLKDIKDLEKFKKKVDNIKMISYDESEKYQGKAIQKTNGFSILEVILESEEEVVTANWLHFLNEFDCEWAYVIDFDINTFEIYKGGNKEPLTPDDRFYNEEDDDEEDEDENEDEDEDEDDNEEECHKTKYYPPKLFVKYDLDDLPLPNLLRDDDYEDHIIKKNKKLKKNNNKGSSKSSWIAFYRCSECQKESKEKENYCSGCGRHMVYN